MGETKQRDLFWLGAAVVFAVFVLGVAVGMAYEGRYGNANIAVVNGERAVVLDFQRADLFCIPAKLIEAESAGHNFGLVPSPEYVAEDSE